MTQLKDLERINTLAYNVFELVNDDGVSVESNTVLKEDTKYSLEFPGFINVRGAFIEELQSNSIDEIVYSLFDGDIIAINNVDLKTLVEVNGILKKLQSKE